MTKIGLLHRATRKRGLQKRLPEMLLLASSGLILLTGCGLSSGNKIAAGGGGSTPVGPSGPGGPATQGPKMQGHVKGGNPPVTGATITLYSASTQGYKAASNLLASTPTDGSGTFNFPLGSYTCAPADQLYVVATQGNPGLGNGGNNPNLSMMAALGSCSALPSFVNIDEVTTVASVYALASFMTDAAHVGTSSTNITGLQNAFATVKNLVDIPSGTALAVTPAYSAHNVPNYNSSQVPYARVNALANALAACVNSSGGHAGDNNACGQLFTATTVGSSVPTDTLQAALSIAQHQGNNVSAIAGLITANPFFQPSLTPTQVSAMTDWSIAVVYQGAGLATANVGGGTPTANTLAIDGSGNIWVPGVNNANGFVAVFNNQGAPLTISPSATATTVGGFSGAGIVKPHAIAFDMNNYAWIGGSTSGNLVVIDSNGNVKGNPADPALLVPAANGIAMDSNGNMWVSSNTGNCLQLEGGSILEFDPSAYTNELQEGGYVSDAAGDTCPYFIAMDGFQDLWTYDQGNYTGGDVTYNGMAQIVLANGSVVNAPPNYLQVSPPSMVAIDASGNGWFNLDSIPAGLQYFDSADQGPTGVQTLPNYLSPTSSPVAVDGANLVWTVVQRGYGADPNGLPRYPAGLVAYSPAAGAFVSPSSSTGNYLTDFTGYLGWDLPAPGSAYDLAANVRGIGIDASGNVWIAGQTEVAGSAGGGSIGSQLVEFVGIATPAATPLNPSIIGVEP